MFEIRDKLWKEKIPVIGWGLAIEGAIEGYNDEGWWGAIKGALW